MGRLQLRAPNCGLTTPFKIQADAAGLHLGLVVAAGAGDLDEAVSQGQRALAVRPQPACSVGETVGDGHVRSRSRLIRKVGGETLSGQLTVTEAGRA